MIKLNLDFSHLKQQDMLDEYNHKINDIYTAVINKTSEGSDMLGWLDWVNEDHTKLINRIEKVKENWKGKIRYVLVIGTGGSYLGAKAGVEFCNMGDSPFDLLFAPTFSSNAVHFLMKKLGDEPFGIVVVSKSGTTLESSILFRIFQQLLEKNMGNKHRDFIVCVTDKTKGLLKQYSTTMKYQSFEIEDDIGGRYSSLTPVGLVPMILSGVDGKMLLKGALQCKKDMFHKNLSKNTAALYAAIRHKLSNKHMECLIGYDPDIFFTLEKAKQLFAESEGKKGNGIMPVILNCTPDLHSVGQLLQEGKQGFFNTTFWVKKCKFEVTVPRSDSDIDKLNWLHGSSLHSINGKAFAGTVDAHHHAANIDNLIIEIDDWSAEAFGYVYFFLSLSAMFSAYLLEVNPFDQPGVEAYKSRMFDLLKNN